MPRLCNAVWSRRFGGCVVEQWHWYFTLFKLFYFPNIKGLVQRIVRFEYAYHYTPNIYIYIYIYIYMCDSLCEIIYIYILYMCDSLWNHIYIYIIYVWLSLWNHIYIYIIYVWLYVKSRLKSQNRIMRKRVKSLISTINFTIISIFDVTLLSQYYRYKCYNFHRMFFTIWRMIFCRIQQITKKLLRPIQEIYFHLNTNLRKPKKNCATSSLCRVSVHLFAARNTAGNGILFFRLLLQKHKYLFLLWMYTYKSKPFTILIIFMTKRSSCFHC